MTGTTRSSEGLDTRRRKLLFRSWHRGMREMDLILGNFADAHIDRLNDEQLDLYEALLDITDRDLLSWIVGEVQVPEAVDHDVYRQIVASRSAFTI
ncbi:antitoxin CptB [Aminobacter niigataensis]|uniref:FAD assembly factor SdhE n=1 Tax=Aminobacter niigataensis TaxID=83265 RepID=A0ABR6KXN7_9HYPH|nr:succinate dehydrogenase assembly factor 2 [Aminobacter niigataensis]MBB4649284.1 antitoxin CptB [Aminobacter niigataensis]